MEHNEIVHVGTSEATGREMLELPASVLVLREQDRAWAEAYDGEDTHGANSRVIVWRDEDGQYMVRTGVRRVLHATTQDERVTVEVQRLFLTGRECVEVWPDTLIVGVNPRLEANLTDSFVANIEEKGVRTTVNGHLDDDGRIVVDEGQRRVRAAAEKGVRVAVMLDPAFDGDERADRVKTLMGQVNENLHREDMARRDYLGAMQEFLELEVPAGDIAKGLSMDRNAVDASIATLGSKAAREAVVNEEIDYTTGATIAEFEDHPELQQRLLRQARDWPGRVDHLAQRFRDDLERERQGREALEALEGKGVKVIPWPGERSGSAKLRLLEDLRAKPTSKAGVRVQAKAHAKCAGHAASLKPGDEEPTFVCLDFKVHGHAERNAPTGQVFESGSTRSLSAQERAERSLTRERNKAMAAANTVRRGFLQKTLLPRKAMPQNALSFVAVVIAEGAHEMVKAMEIGHPDALDWLRIKTDEHLGRYSRTEAHPIAARVKTATRATAEKHLFVMALAAIEQKIDKSGRRGPSRAVRTYLELIEGWGHKLDDIEKLARDWTPEHSITPTTAADAESDPAADDEDTEV